MPQISGKCRWTQPDCRPPMILGTPGLPYLYRGNVKNPFQPHVELIAVALDSRTAGQSLERIREIAKQHELSEVDVSEQVRRQHVHVFRFASEASAGEQERIGEVLALRWGKIDWQRQAIIVDEGLYEGEVSTPKTTSGVRILPMTKLLFSALLQWKTGKTVGADNSFSRARSAQASAGAISATAS